MRKIIPSIIFMFLAETLGAQHALQLDSFPFRPDPEQHDSFLLDFGFESGAFIGRCQEWVYFDRDSDGAYDDLRSRLDWQQLPLYYMGAAGSAMLFPRFFIAVGGWLGIPGPIGALEDFDWNETTGINDQYSHHDNYSKGACLFDVNAGYSLVSEDVLILNAIVGFGLKQFRMYGRDGWYEYPPGSPAVPMSGEVIDYELNFFIPYAALEAAWPVLPWLSVDVFLAASPCLATAYARDYHLQTVPPHYFQDLPAFGFALSGVVNLTFHLGGGLDLCLKNYIHWMPPFSGNTYTDGFLNPSYRGGASLLQYGVSFSFHFGFGT